MALFTQRRLKHAAATLLLLIVAFLPTIQIEQSLFHRHVVHLIADMQAINLHTSNWTDAQKIMHRWGRWAHYQGICDPRNCRYDITVEDGFTRLIVSQKPAWLQSPMVWCLSLPGSGQLGKLLYILGSKPGIVVASFIVQDGLIVRKGIESELFIPPHVTPDDIDGYALFSHTVSVPRVANWVDRNFHDQQLSRNLYYSASRPGGCEGCMAVTLVYSDRTPQAIVKKLSINPDCFSAQTRCKWVEDLLPASSQFHLYDGSIGARPASPTEEPSASEPPPECSLPAWVRARDANRVALVDTLDVQLHPKDPDNHETARVRVLAWLKNPPASAQDTLSVIPFTTRHDGTPPQAPENLIQGEHYLLFDFDEPFSPQWPKTPEMELDRCGILPDTPDTRAEVQRGAALNDPLRLKELHAFPW